MPRVLVLGPKKHSSDTRMGPFLMQITLLAQCGGHMSQQSSGSLGTFGVPTGDRVGVSGAGRRLIHSDQTLPSKAEPGPMEIGSKCSMAATFVLLQIKKKPPPCPTLQITRSLNSGVHLGDAKCCLFVSRQGALCPHPVCMVARVGGW